MNSTSRFTLAAHTFGLVWQHDIVDAVQRLAGEGFSTIEVLAMPPHLDSRHFDAALQRRLRDALARTGIQVIALDLPSNDINLGSTTQEVVDFTIESYLALLDVAAALAAPWVVVLPGRRHGLLPPPDDRLLDVVRRAFDRLSPEAERRGVRLLLENHPLTLLPDAGSIAGFLTAHAWPNIDVVYDVANGVAIAEDPVEGLKTVRPFLRAVHLSDSPRGQWRHDPIGSGDIDFVAIRDQLTSSGFDGPVVTEIIAERALQRLVEARAALEGLGWNFR